MQQLVGSYGIRPMCQQPNAGLPMSDSLSETKPELQSLRIDLLISACKSHIQVVFIYFMIINNNNMYNVQGT